MRGISIILKRGHEKFTSIRRKMMKKKQDEEKQERNAKGCLAGEGFWQG